MQLNQQWKAFFALPITIAPLVLVGINSTLYPIHAHSANTQATPTGSHHHPQHEKLEVPKDQPVPQVQLIVHPDAKKGWNLEIKLTNFRFAPERVNGQSSTTEGHAHLYINGKKITRIYSSWYYVESLPPGQHQLKVSLNANGHQALYSQGKPLESVVQINVP